MIDHRDSQRAVNSFASRVARRLLAAGAPAHMIEDLKQELWVAWCKARDSYDDAGGASFNTYLWGGMKLHINRWMLNNVNKRHSEVIAKSLDAELQDGESKNKLQDIIPAADPTPDKIVEIEADWKYAIKKLTPKARQFMEILRDPPDMLLEQVRQIEAKANFAKQQGIPMPFANRVTTSMIFALMDISYSEKTKIAGEIRKVGDRMQRVSR